MHWQPLGKEVKIMVTQVMDALNQIILLRRTKDDQTEDQVEVNMIYSPKQTVLWDLINKNQHIRMPAIVCSIGSFQRDINRVFNKIEGSYYNVYPVASGSESLLQPLPVNIGLNVSIMCKYQSDMDQILGQFAYFDPYIVVSWKDPLLNYMEVRSEVFWNEAVNLSYPTDTTATQFYRVLGDTTLTIKGWLYKKPQPSIGKIYHVTTNFTALSGINGDYQDLTAMRNEYNTESVYVSGWPQIYRAIPCYTLTGLETEFNLIGTSFDINGHPVSGLFAIPLDPNIYPTINYYDPLSAQPSLSDKFPPFSGIPIPTFRIDDNNVLTFILPSASNFGFVDILAWNEAGYGRLTWGRRGPFTNPWPMEISGREYYQQYQDRSTLGIEIRPSPPSGTYSIGKYLVNETFIIGASE